MPTSHFHKDSTIMEEVLLPRGITIQILSRSGRNIRAKVIGGSAWMWKSQPKNEGFI